MLTDNQIQLLAQWAQIYQALADLKQKENQLRRSIFGDIFPDPKEGTNTAEMPKGYKLKGTHKIDRKVDEAALAAVLKQLPEGSDDQLIRRKPELILKPYRALTEEHRNIFDQALIIKPGMPQLEIIPPKE